MVGCIAIVAISITVVVSIVVVVVAPALADRTPAVKFRSVDVTDDATALGHEIVVHVELETETDMPFVGPHVVVSGTCDSHSDSTKAFFMRLGDVKKGSVLKDDGRLFFAKQLSSPPERCDITLQLTGGRAPESFCYRSGKTVRGACQ